MWAAMGADAANPGGINTTGWSKPFAGSSGSNSMQNYAIFGWSTTEPGRTTAANTQPVASLLTNELGLYDMSGNVSEYCWDVYGDYPVGSIIDYRGPSTSGNRVYRNCNWYFEGAQCAIQFRGTAGWNQFTMWGFRVARW